MGGWDGRVSAIRGDACVPTGVSVWEVGTQGDIKTKADADYTKRARDPMGVSQAEATFVFVTPRLWPGKSKWMATRKGEGVWKDVRVYDADDVAAWLDVTPAVCAWLLSLLGKRPDGVQDLREWWAAWSEATEPPVSRELLLAGRDDTALQLLKWLGQPPSIAELQAGTSDEAVAVFAATAMSRPDEVCDADLSRTLVVRTEDALARLATAASPLVLVTLCGDRSEAPIAIRNGHQVLVPLGEGERATGQAVQVLRLRRGPAQDALVRMGIPVRRAEELAAVARRSMATLRRRMARAKLSASPEWSSPEQGLSVLPLVLAGAWEDRTEGDWGVIQTLAGAPRNECVALAGRWASASDPPLRQVGSTWYAVDKYDGLRLLGRYVTRELSERFAQTAVCTLSIPDPRFELPAEERYMASVIGQELPTSDRLRRSVADTLALLGAMSEDDDRDTMLGHLNPAPIVRDLLERAGRDWRLWATIADSLPLLAEAAPDELLKHVARDLGGAEPAILKLFNSAETEMRWPCDHPHVGLLWALESLAWSRDYIAASSLALARLAELDPAPGSNFNNRPANSLRGIFLIWYPQTSADAEARLQVLDLLRSRHPEVAWKLMLGVLPQPYSSGHSSHRPVHRNWAREERQSIAFDELIAGVQAIGERLLQDVGLSGQRWCNLVNALKDLTPDTRAATLTLLGQIELEAVAPPDRLTLWESLCRTVAHHREFADTDWALGADVLSDLEAARDRLEPTDPVDRYRMLFSNAPALPAVYRRDWHAWDAALGSERTRAAEHVFATSGTDGVVQLALAVDIPGAVGYALGLGQPDAGDEPLVHLGSHTPALNAFAQGYAVARLKQSGFEWGASVLSSEIGKAMSAAQRGLLLACAHPGGSAWDLVDNEPAEVRAAYWGAVVVMSVATEDEVARALARLLQHARPVAAITLICNALRGGLRNVALADAVAALNGLAKDGPEPDFDAGMLAFGVGRLLDALEADELAEPAQLAQYEWHFSALLRGHREPRALAGALSREPALFVDVLRLVYGPVSDAEIGATPDEKARATLAWQLLRDWRVVPGSRPDGSIDGPALREWVSAALAAATDGRLRRWVERHIGYVMTHSAVGPDGLWPPAEVCDVIESTDGDEIARGFEVQVLNNRGVVTRAPFEGGVQEQELASRYSAWAGACATRWPRTARVLRSLADGYRSDAAREDADAALAEDLEH
jgi:hypothetical protein